MELGREEWRRRSGRRKKKVEEKNSLGNFVALSSHGKSRSRRKSLVERVSSRRVRGSRDEYRERMQRAVAGPKDGEKERR